MKNNENKSVLILGFFDGIHAGHRKVIQNAVTYAKNNKAKAILITFETSPAEYFNKSVKYIFPRNYSYKLIKKLGVDEIIEQDFSEFVNMSAQNYLENFLIQQFSPIAIFTGFNYTFGKNKQEGSEFLQLKSFEYNYKYFSQPAESIDNKIISSTYIKDLLKNGNIELANKLLCSNFTIESKVIKGLQLGRKLGFPTANLIYPNNIIKLPYGVYSAKYENKKAILNWGIKPTLGLNNEILELHVIDFDENLYDEIIHFEIIKKIRDEKKFINLESLKTQIQKDIEAC